MDLLEDLMAIHLVFHVSLLRKYILDELHVPKGEPIQIEQKLSYEEKPIMIINRASTETMIKGSIFYKKFSRKDMVKKKQHGAREND